MTEQKSEQVVEQKKSKTIEARVARLEARISRKQEARDKLNEEIKLEVEQLLNLDRLRTVKAGDVLTFNVGRGETRRELAGTVTGVADTEKGLRYRVYTGSGFDAEVFTLSPSDVLAVQPRPEPALA